MVVENIYLRAFFGLFSIVMGAVFMTIHFNRDKDTLWGAFFRLGAKDAAGSKSGLIPGKIYLILGVMAILSGLIALFFGFRMVAVGA